VPRGGLQTSGSRGRLPAELLRDSKPRECALDFAKISCPESLQQTHYFHFRSQGNSDNDLSQSGEFAGRGNVLDRYYAVSALPQAQKSEIEHAPTISIVIASLEIFGMM
jgi:hypothetical protein